MDNRSGRKNILIFHLGGATLDVSLLTIKDHQFEVKSNARDTHLGGRDFDFRLNVHLVTEIWRKYKINILSYPSALTKLSTRCERAKRKLSISQEVTIDIDCPFGVTNFTITRAKFEEINYDLFNKCLNPVHQCLKDGGMDKNRVDKVLLVGGSTRIPRIQKLFRKLFDGKDLCKNINSDEAVVVYGATIQAALLTGKKNKKLENIDVIPRNIKIPVEKTKQENKIEGIIRAGRLFYRSLPDEMKEAAKKTFREADRNNKKSLTEDDVIHFLNKRKMKDEIQKVRYLMGVMGRQNLDIEDATSLWYTVVIRPSCKSCNDIIDGCYYSCFKCFENNATHDICQNCYQKQKFAPDHGLFLDNYAILMMKNARVDTSRGVANKTTALDKTHKNSDGHLMEKVLLKFIMNPNFLNFILLIPNLCSIM